MSRFKVLVVDDSPFMRKVFSDFIAADSAFEVAATASNGLEAVERTKELRPDVITMDLEMPTMNGLEALKRIMASVPTPVIMLSAVTDNGTRDTIRALQYGAVDFIRKPDGAVKLDIHQVGDQLREKLHVAVEMASSGNYRLLPLIEEKPDASSETARPEEAANRAPPFDPEKSRVAPPANVSSAPSDLPADVPPIPEERFPASGTTAAAEKSKAFDSPDAPSAPARAAPESRVPNASKKTLPPAFGGKGRSPSADGVTASFRKSPSPESQADRPPGEPAPRERERERDRLKEKVDSPSPSSPEAPAVLAAGGKRRSDDPGDRDAESGSPAFRHVVAIGTSTGGPRALHEVITGIPADFPAPILIVQHMPPKFTLSLAQRLDSFSQIRVREASDGETVRAGTAYIAPGGMHMVLKKEGPSRYRISLTEEEPRSGHRPSVDKLFESLLGLKDLKRHAVLMTGMGSDGAKGMKALRDDGAETTIAEAAETCIVYGMPRSAVELGAASRVLNLQQIAPALVHEVGARKR